MPGYLVDEGGERTHAVLPVEEYERLMKASEQLSAVRRYAMDIVSVMGEGEDNSSSEDNSSGEDEDSEAETKGSQKGYSWQR